MIEREIVAVHQEPVAGHTHITAVELADGTREDVADVIAAIDAGQVYVMRPPEGAPAYRAHQETGLPLLIQTHQCRDCAERVIWA